MGSKGWGLSSVDVDDFTNCQSRRSWVVVVEIEKCLNKIHFLINYSQKSSNGNGF